MGSLTTNQEAIILASYDWNSDDLQRRGLYLDMAPWQACAFSVVKHG